MVTSLIHLAGWVLWTQAVTSNDVTLVLREASRLDFKK
jgi:hypothetical protein